MADLSANENPLGPSPEVLTAIAANAAYAHRYPDSQGGALKAALAKKLGISTAKIVLGNGASEIFDLIARMLFADQGEALVGWPSFPTYHTAIERAHGEVILVPLRDYAYDLDAIAERVRPQTRLIILGNPNNPTGVAFSRTAFDRFLARVPPGPVICIDEAYTEYAAKDELPDALDYIREGWPLIAVRTLSKAYGLAGLRIGYALASPPLAKNLNKQRQSFNTSSLAQIAAIAALGDTEHLARTVALNASGRAWLKERLSALGLLAVASEANFLLLKVGDSAAIHAHLKEDGVLVRQLESFGLTDHLRVSVGTPNENARFIDALQRALARL